MLRSPLLLRTLPELTIVASLLVWWPSGVRAQGPAQDMPPGPVRYTEVVDHMVRQTVQLPGVVESRTSGMVAGEVAGLVVAIPVRPGDRVKRGRTLAQLRDDTVKLQLRSAEGELSESRARLDLAQSQLKRARELFADSVISQDQMDDAVSEHTAWQARVDRTGAQVDLIKLALDRTVIRAPYTGVIVEKHTEVGQWIQLGGPVVEMTSLLNLDVHVDVPERFYDLLSKGTEVAVDFEALPGVALTGKIERIIPRADPQARSFPVKVGVANPDGRVAVGMLARVNLPIGEPHQALLVPKDSVMQDGDQRSIYRIKPDDTVEPVSVQTGQGVGSWIVIRGPVAPGEKVVTRGNERLQPGQAVRGEFQEYPPP